MNDDHLSDADTHARPSNSRQRATSPARLRLVRTAREPTTRVAHNAASAIALRPGVYDVRFTASRWPNASHGNPLPGTHDKRRLHVRHKEGITMKTIERIIRTVGRFAVGFGTGLALVCAVVIVRTDIGLGPPRVAKPAEAIRLDPVVVTITAERFDALQAESRGATKLAGLVRRHAGEV